MPNLDKGLYSGSVGASVLFVAASPRRADVARGEPLVGAQREIFKASYLAPLGLAFDDVALTYVCPEVLDDSTGLRTRGPTGEEIAKWSDWLDELLDYLDAPVVVALGHVAKTVLGDRANFVLPHPEVLRRKKNSGEVDRKIAQVKKALSETFTISFDGKSIPGHFIVSYTPTRELVIKSVSRRNPDEVKGQSSTERGAMATKIIKSDATKHIVYGVVMDPYDESGSAIDSHGDFCPPAMIENAAHLYMQGARDVGVQHQAKADARVVESWVEQYPSREDYLAALAGEPHKITRRSFGADKINSGSWVLGVQLGDAEWHAYETGELNAFSPGGIGLKTEIMRAELPVVTFIDLVPAEYGKATEL